MAKNKTKKISKSPSIKQLPEEPFHLDMTFEEAIKKALNTPLKHSKIYKNKK